MDDLSGRYVVQSRKKQGQSMTITFREDEILIVAERSRETEAKGWEWVRSAQWINGTYYVEVHPPKMTVILKTLNEEERTAFAGWAANRRKKEAV
ncbi:hypothetical protein QWJ34_12295 [Saccharibacillus sp. CPCC 101409]|uniref:hypothetical protein n=1 Tax=Saccharibacillus sp. CPCC 101409 TaxID=3058041 RepID=UPI002671C24D|nr:hypothetical protein [Saccharibacillus sp. CPCC 101409]MDO3410543.1 hypothetical protein [Saccharibacillus sp. CPCC 101409]